MDIEKTINKDPVNISRKDSQNYKEKSNYDFYKFYKYMNFFSVISKILMKVIELLSLNNKSLECPLRCC